EGEENEIVSAADLSADSAFPSDRALPAAGAECADAPPGHRRVEPARKAWTGAVHAAADRPDGGADRALPRPAAEPGPVGGHLSATGGRGRAMAPGTWRCQGRRAGAGYGAAALGSERQGAGRVPAGPGDDGRAHRVDPGPRRRLRHAAGGGHDAGTGIAPPGDEIRQAEAGPAPDGARAGTRDRDHLGGAG